MAREAVAKGGAAKSSERQRSGLGQGGFTLARTVSAFSRTQVFSAAFISAAGQGCGYSPGAPSPPPRLLLPAALLAALTSAAFAQNVEFSQSSVPAGVINQTDYPLINTRVSTVTAPDPAAGYRFTHWMLNGVRAEGPNCCSLNPVVFTITEPVTAVAHFILENQDLDADGLPDWWEMRCISHYTFGATDDPDGDGYDNATEFLRGTCPTGFNEFVAGGVSRRRGDFVIAATTTTDPTVSLGGISRRRSAVQTVIPNYQFRYTLTEISSPAGVLSQSRVVSIGQTVSLTVAPDPFSGYRFTGWLVNGLRLDSPAQAQPIPITVTADTLAVARYFPETQDSDGDGLPDWMEWKNFEALAYDINSDPDGDGYSIAVEQFRGYSLIAANEPAPGGVSRRRGNSITVDTTGRLVWRTVSIPATILDDTQRHPAGTMINVPDRTGHIFGSYRFAWWDLNGTRVEDPSGAALGRFSFTINTDSTTTAHYYDSTADTDADGLPDWYEWSFMGGTGEGGGGDGDGDGWTNTDEYFRGYSPRAFNLTGTGSLSRRRSLLTAVNAIFLPNPPAIGVHAARDITRTSAVLSALVNPVGSPTTLYFEYGPTAAYGSTTAVISIGSGLAPANAEAMVTGLLPDSTYHFRAVATNTQGTAQGRDFTFRTLSTEYGLWAESYGVGGPSGDDDFDGLSNAEEYGFGTHPKAANPYPVTLMFGNNPDNICALYPRNKAAFAAGVQFIAEWSDTLGPPWSSAGVTHTVISDMGAVEQVEAAIPRGTGGRRFVRLRVELP